MKLPAGWKRLPLDGRAPPLETQTGHQVAQRLKRTRERAGFESASLAARHFKWNENTYRSHENGERGLKAAVASTYAEAFGVSLHWLLLGDETAAKSYTISVVHKIVGGGVLTSQSANDSISWQALVNFVLPSDIYACVVDTDTMNPRYGRKDLLVFGKNDYINVRERPVTHTEGLAWTERGEGYFGHVSTGAKGSNVACVGSPTLLNIDIIRLDRLELIVRSDVYRLERYELD